MNQQMDLKAMMSSPLSDFFVRSIAPNIGTPMVDMARMKVKQTTIMDYRPNFCMYQLAPLSPRTAPIVDQAAIQRP